MPLFEAVRHDGAARAGILTVGSDENAVVVKTPAAVDTDALFPSLKTENKLTSSDSIPLFSPKRVMDEFSVSYEGINLKNPSLKGGVSGDLILVSNWQTVLDNPKAYVDAVIEMKKDVPWDTCWYAPASALPSNVCSLIASGFDLFDYRAVDLKTAQNIFCTADGEFPASEWFGTEKNTCRCSGCMKGDLKEHNRNMLDAEIAACTRFILDGHFRELFERRCRNTAAQVAVLRRFDDAYEFTEMRTPVIRPCRLYANSSESMKRAEVKRFVERVIERFVPQRHDAAVLIPCSAKKPYSTSQSHMKFQSAIQNRAHEIIITSPLGIVPRELERIYPAGHYDVPVTGYWDGEERAFITDAIARYFTKNHYDRVYVHLDGDALEIAEAALKRAGVSYTVTANDKLTSQESLRALSSALREEKKQAPNVILGTLAYQFGQDSMNSSEIDLTKLKFKGKFMREKVLLGEKQMFSVDTDTGYLRPTFDGWSSVIKTGYRVWIDNFVPQGDILAPGVMDCSPEIREGDEVYVVGDKAAVTGRAMMSAEEMRSSKRGVAVRVRKVKKL